MKNSVGVVIKSFKMALNRPLNERDNNLTSFILHIMKKNIFFSNPRLLSSYKSLKIHLFEKYLFDKFRNL